MSDALSTNIDDLQKQVNTFIRLAQKEHPTVIYDAMVATARDIEGRAKVLVHKKTGNLARSITHVGDKNAMMVAVGTNMFYGPYLEYGTGMQSESPFGHGKGKGGRPYPYMRPAFQEKLGNIFDNYKRRLEKSLASK